MPTQIKFDDELTHAGTGGGSNRHHPVLYFRRGAEPPVKFDGTSIPGICRVDRDSFHKNGKWSFTTWWISIADGVTAWRLSGSWIESVNDLVDGRPRVRLNRWEAISWAEVDAVGVPREVARAIAPKTLADRLDANAQPI
jgi:hypothetical protein